MKQSEPECTVRDIRAIAHADSGDIECDQVGRILINGSVLTFHIRGKVYRDATVTSSTLHVGDLSVLKPLIQPVSLRAGDSITIIQDVVWLKFCEEAQV